MRGRAYGLDIEADFELLGIGGPPAYDGSRHVSVETGLAGDVETATRGHAVERLIEIPGAEGRPIVTVDAMDGGAGFAIAAEGFGLAWVRGDGGRCLCAPAGGPAWLWQRFLAGQVLPFAAVLAGIEAFHASAVVLDGTCIAIAAGSGVGKTSLALNLALRGLPLVSDDVLAVEATDGDGLVAHPAPGLANVDARDSKLAERIEESGVGRRLGETERDVRMEVRRHDRPVRPGTLFFVDRTATGDRPVIEPLSPVEPRLLLAATFNLALRSPERLSRQLEVCGRLAESCRVFKVSSPPGVDARMLAAEIHRTALNLEPQRS